MRRGGLNFVAYTHTDADVDLAVAMAGEVFAELARHLAAADLESAVLAAPPEAGIRRF
jgi:hypothetical protein